jgi:hypothetical protein
MAGRPRGRAAVRPRRDARRSPVGKTGLCALLHRRLSVRERIVWVQATTIRRLRPENRGNGEVPRTMPDATA